MAEARWFPPIEDYYLAHRCSQCGAEPWTPCTIRRRTGNGASHAARMDQGLRRYHHDIGEAPWVEEREPGRLYHSFVYPKGVRSP